MRTNRCCPLVSHLSLPFTSLCVFLSCFRRHRHCAVVDTSVLLCCGLLLLITRLTFLLPYDFSIPISYWPYIVINRKMLLCLSHSIMLLLLLMWLKQLAVLIVLLIVARGCISSLTSYWGQSVMFSCHTRRPTFAPDSRPSLTVRR